MHALLLMCLAVSEPSRPVVSVLYFDNQTNRAEYDVLRKGFADMMVTDLVAWDGVTVVERDKLESVLSELKLQQSKAFDKATAVKVGKLMGAQYLVTGALLLQGEHTLRIDARLIAAEGGKDVTAASVTGEKDKVFDLEQELVTKLTAGIDAKIRDVGARRKAKVPDLDALLAYSKAIDLSDQGKLEEASAAMQALVSKAPAFLMARERKQELLKRLEEFEKRKKDMTTSSVLELGKLADEELKQPFDKLAEPGQCRFLAMREVKARYLMRVIKQSLSSHGGNTRIALKGKEAQALGIEHAWVENQRKAMAEWGSRQSCSTRELPPETTNLLRDASFGHIDLRDPFWGLVEFVLEGRARDGEEGFAIAPALGDLDPNEQKSVFALIDQRLERALAEYERASVAQKQSAERPVIEMYDLKAKQLLRLDRDEDAIAALQKILDLFPSSPAAPRAEEEIKKLLGAVHDNSRDKQERWAKALTSCEDMDIRVGMDTLGRKVARLGLKGLDAQAAELEKACKQTPKNRSAFAYMYRDLALEAGRHEDCDGFRAWFRKYIEAGGSVSDMMGYQKNYIPWCELKDVMKSVLWFTARLDENWTLEMADNLSSVLSYDQKVLSLNASNHGMGDSMYLRLEAKGADAFACTTARWNRRGGGTLEGTCDVKLTKHAAEKGEYDEGTFGAHFVEKGDFPRKIELSQGTFRLRRQ
jgi:TolB-like protein